MAQENYFTKYNIKIIFPTNGKILIDNKILNIKKDIRRYQNLISLISQDTFLIEGSVKKIFY